MLYFALENSLDGLSSALYTTGVVRPVFLIYLAMPKDVISHYKEDPFKTDKTLSNSNLLNCECNQRIAYKLSQLELC